MVAMLLPNRMLAANEIEFNFLEQHCFDCHSGDAPDGNLDLTAFDLNFETIQQVRSWSAVLHRVEAGEMPPPDYESLSHDEVETWLQKIRPQVISADQKLKQVVLRRLNRSEYEHTIHDLLHIDIPLTQYLPEDQLSLGFDTVGESLAISTEQLEGYLKAAEVAINEAIVLRKRPETRTETVDSIQEITPYIGKNYDLIEGRTAVFNASRTTYSKISTRRFRVKERGRYEFSFELASVNSDELVSVMADADGTYFFLDAKSTPERITKQAILNPNRSVQFHLLERPFFVRDPVKNKEPGMAIGPVTITGPLYDSWPPASHRELIGEIDLRKAGIEDSRPILQRFLPKAFRRPVQPEEIDQYVQLVQSRLDVGQSFEQSLKVALVTALCSPHFLYLGEQQTDSETSVSDTELASRLSYFLWSSKPDQQLMQLAQQEKLSNPSVIRQQLRRMLADEKAERFVQRFTDYWLHLRRIDETFPDQKLYSDFDPYLKQCMVDETRGFFRHILNENRSVFEFLDSDYAMLNRRLARHYDVANVTGTTLRPVSLPASSIRGGLLTHASILKVTANGTNTSPVVRGVWVLENIMGRHIPPPPASVPAIEPDLRGATTIRERLEKHRMDQSCQACHQMIDPPGFALESFDPIGKFRTHYRHFKVNPQHADKGWGSFVNGAAVDSASVTDHGEHFENIREFRDLLLKHREDFARCLTEKLITYGLGRELGISDQAEIDRIAKAAVERNDGLQTLMEHIVTSPLFSGK